MNKADGVGFSWGEKDVGIWAYWGDEAGVVWAKRVWHSKNVTLEGQPPFIWVFILD